jgi:hypothetical protein
MYEILQVLDMDRSYPNALLACRLWYEGEDFPKVEKLPPWNNTAAHTTLRGLIQDAHSTVLSCITVL